MKRIFTFACMLAAALMLGCSSNTATDPQAKNSKPDSHDHHDHDHAAHGPNGGHLIELGQENYHAELVHDDAAHVVAIYLLDATAKQPVTSTNTELVLNLAIGGSPKQYTLKAAPQGSEPEGQTSRFQLEDEALAHLLAETPSLAGRFTVNIDGKDYTGGIKHEAHDHHDHGHDHGHDHDH